MSARLDRINTFFEHLPEQVRIKKIWILALFILATAGVFTGVKNVTIDESLAAYFHKDDPVKQAYDQFRAVFGGDEYHYIVYRAKDGDIFSQASIAALKKVHEDLVNYRLKMAPGASSPLDHIDEVKSLINVKYMESGAGTLYARSFIGDRLPETGHERQVLRQKALDHPDYPKIYLSRDCRYGGIVIRTDFNAELDAFSRDPSGAGGFDDDEAFPNEGFGFDDTPLADTAFGPEAIEEAQGAGLRTLAPSDIKDYPFFVKAVQKILDDPETNRALEFYPVGTPSLMGFFAEAVIQDMGRLMGLLLLLITLVLWLLFRSLAAVVWPVVLVAVTIIWILGIIGHSGISMTAMLQVIIFLALSVGIADAVHILSGYLFFRNQGMAHAKALAAVMKKSGLACLLTSVTTSVGLLSLVLVPLKPISSFGLFAASAVMLAFVFTVLILPLMLDFWSPVSRKQTIEKDHLIQKGLKRIEGLGTTHAGFVILIFSGAGIVLLLGLAQLRVDSNFVEVIKKGLPLRQAYTVVDDHMGGTGAMEVMLDFKSPNALKDPKVLFAMESIQAFMESHNQVVKTVSLVNVVKESHKALHNDHPEQYLIPAAPDLLEQVLFLFENANPKDRTRLVSDDYSKARIGLNAANVGSVQAMEILETIQTRMDAAFSELHGKYPGLEVTLTGNMALLSIMLDYIAWAQIKSFGLALVVISVIIVLVLGSKKAGLVAMVPNLFPILAAFGLMGYFNVPLDADTLIIAPIIIGLAVDDTIHFLTHFRIALGKTKDIGMAAVSAIREAGQAISFTSLILGAGFLVFLLSFHNGLSHFGIFASAAVMTALLTDLFLLPALCRVFNLDFRQKG